MVMFRTGIGLKEGLVAEEVAATHALHREFSKPTTGRLFVIIRYNPENAISRSLGTAHPPVGSAQPGLTMRPWWNR